MTKYRRIILRLTLSFAAFVGIAIAVAVILRSITDSSISDSLDQTRGPSSVLYDEDGEPVFWEESLEEIEEKSANDPSFGGTTLSSKKSSRVFTGVRSLSISEAERKTGIPAKRARLVRFHFANFKTAVTHMNEGGQRFVDFPLFNDVNLRIRLERPSSYSVNTGVYWGQVADDDQSRVRLFVEGSSMNATIETKGRVYKVMVADDDGPEHIVLEGL